MITQAVPAFMSIVSIDVLVVTEENAFNPMHEPTQSARVRAISLSQPVLID